MQVLIVPLRVCHIGLRKHFDVAGKQKQTRISENVDLRRELNELEKEKDKYDTLSEQIQNAESLLAERDFAKSNEDDIQALRDLGKFQVMNRCVAFEQIGNRR